MTHARARLYTGITGVGLVVVACAAALVFELPTKFVSTPSTSIGVFSILFALALGSAVFVLPLDIVGGVLLPRAKGGTVRMAPFLARWTRGALIQAVILAVGALLIHTAAVRSGTATSVAVFGAIMIVLLMLQGRLSRAVGGMATLRSADRDGVVVVEAEDESFTGGLAGLPGRDEVIIPSTWYDVLGQSGVDAQIRRRREVARRGWRAQGVALALVWNLAGFALASSAPGSNNATLPGLVTTVCWMNLWTFVGLLTLPVLSRRAVFAADDAALQAGIPRRVLATNIASLERLQDDEPVRSEALEWVFHPVPAVSRRMGRLGTGPLHRWAPWNVARTALFLTWAGFGLIARTVHCNSGKPESWVLLPCD